jgi:hypothetical protein
MMPVTGRVIPNDICITVRHHAGSPRRFGEFDSEPALAFPNPARFPVADAASCAT